jgi:extradiol dioxygenase family protein
MLIRRLAAVVGRRLPLLALRRSALATVPPSFECHSPPAPGSPFHHAFPVHCLDSARAFYGGVLGCQEGRTSEKWIDFALHGHQIVAHWVGKDYRCQDYYNPVDGDGARSRRRAARQTASRARSCAHPSPIPLAPFAGAEVPVPHFGLALTLEQWTALAERVRAANVKFIVEPTLRFKGMPGEQHTMFFKDPSGNNLEFKAMAKPENLFAKYNVAAG